MDTRTDPPDFYLAALNREQRLAVEHGVTPAAAAANGPLLVIAGAGSGKTDTVAHRVAHLIVNGADPHRILLLTFSRRAAAEMERRAGRILDRILKSRSSGGASALPWSGTFHGIGARLLRACAERIGLSRSFTVQDRSDSEDLMGMTRHELQLASTANRFPAKDTCVAIYSRTINSEATLGTVLKGAFPWCAHWEAELKTLFGAYVAAKQAQHVLDYDDLLLYWAHMMMDPALAQEIGARFDHVLVDEYQDTNLLQSSILRAMKPDGRGVTVVGDDAQSIYSFRAATVRNILDFPGQFSVPATVVTLERNYRSTQPILDAANAVIGLAAERYTKNLWTDKRSSQKPLLVTVRDEADSARCVAERILEHRENGMALKAQAVLFRSASHSAHLELELARRDIPFVKYGGLRFLEGAHVKDVLSILRWAENPRSRLAGFRAARLVPGIGQATAMRVQDALDSSSDPSVALASFRVPSTAADDWRGLVEVIRMLRAPGASWPGDIDLVLRWYEPQLHRIYDDARIRAADLEQLQRIAGTFPSRERFLTEVTLDPPQAVGAEAGAPGKDDDYLILSTIHSAKGQEWKAVFVLNVVDGCIPSDMSTGTDEELEEERRLLYVAMTRARDYLQLMVPQRFYVHQQAAYGDHHVYAQRSRFLPESVAKHFAVEVWPLAAAALAAAEPRTGGTPQSVDLAARIREIWC